MARRGEGVKEIETDHVKYVGVFLCTDEDIVAYCFPIVAACLCWTQIAVQ